MEREKMWRKGMKSTSKWPLSKNCNTTVSDVDFTRSAMNDAPVCRSSKFTGDSKSS